MGLYRANLNLPILRFGKTDILKDDDVLVEHWLASGALTRLDGPKLPDPKPVEYEPVTEPAPVGEDPVAEPALADGAGPEPVREFEPGPPQEPEPVPAPSGMNPDLGIRFDDEDDA